MTHEGYLRHLLVRKAVKTGQILVDIVTTTQLDFDMSEITEKLRNLQLDGTLVGLLHTYNDSIADVVKNERTEILFGQDYIQEELLGLTFNISAFSFFQTNSLSGQKFFIQRQGNMSERQKIRLYLTSTAVQVQLHRFLHLWQRR